MLIKKFHQVEEKQKLFDILDENNYPIWDILRYHVFLKYYYPDDENRRLKTFSSKRAKDYFSMLKKSILFLYSILFNNKNKILIQVASRLKDEKGNYFDKFATPLIKEFGANTVVLETFTKEKTAYKTTYDLSSFVRRIYKSRNLDMNIYSKICNSFKQEFGLFKSSYEELNSIYRDFQSDIFFYSILIRRLKPRSIFMSVGNPKAIIWVARNNNIPTYLLQHAAILYEEAEYSYPHSITINSNILFVDNLLTYGEYWGKNINIPTKNIQNIGSNYKKPLTAEIREDNDILVISTIIHGKILADFILKYASLRPDLNFTFKLHPNEYHLETYYTVFFEDIRNIRIITTELNTNNLISSSKLILLIVSTVLYEALDQNKKVAIYKKLNYESNRSLFSLPNIYLFDSIDELNIIIDKKTLQSECLDFYSTMKYNVLSKLSN